MYITQRHTGIPQGKPVSTPTVEVTPGAVWSLPIPSGSPSRGDVTVYVWHKPAELTHSFLFCSCVYFCLYGHFNCISFHEFSWQLSIFSLCSSGLISALLVLSTIYFYMKVSFSPDIIFSGWLGSKHQIINWLWSLSHQKGRIKQSHVSYILCLAGDTSCLVITVKTPICYQTQSYNLISFCGNSVESTSEIAYCVQVPA